MTNGSSNSTDDGSSTPYWVWILIIIGIIIIIIIIVWMVIAMNKKSGEQTNCLGQAPIGQQWMLVPQGINMQPVQQGMPNPSVIRTINTSG